MSPSIHDLRLGLEPGELAILLVFWTFSFGIFVRSYDYPGFTGRFPRLFAGLVLFGATLLLVRNSLPESVRKLTVESGGIDIDTDLGESAEQSSENEAPVQQNAVGRPITDTWFITLSVAVFFVLSYAFGMLWAAPIYVFGYAIWFRKSRVYMVSMMILAFAICYAFYTVLNIPIDTGWLHEFAGIA